MKKLYHIMAFIICMINTVLAQDPPPLPDAPNQGPINGLSFLIIGGVVILVKQYFDRNNKPN
tara:strand:- start:1013 stop:1198 length:186 start_codon:yes stop_codon:yes gene_type:complete